MLDKIGDVSVIGAILDYLTHRHDRTDRNKPRLMTHLSPSLHAVVV